MGGESDLVNEDMEELDVKERDVQNPRRVRSEEDEKTGNKLQRVLSHDNREDL